MINEDMLQINKQSLQFAEDQEDLNESLGNMLSTAECLANRFGNMPKQPPIFEYYNMYGSVNTKNEKNLKSQLQILTKIFRNNHDYMTKKYGKYPFPENLGKNQIINFIIFWRNTAKLENKIYFDNILKILNGNYNITYPKIISNGISKTHPYIQKNLELLNQIKAENCSYNSISKEKEMHKYKNTYNNMMKIYQNNFIRNNHVPGDFL